jgi:hypothetical protein
MVSAFLRTLRFSRYVWRSKTCEVSWPNTPASCASFSSSANRPVVTYMLPFGSAKAFTIGSRTALKRNVTFSGMGRFARTRLPTESRKACRAGSCMTRPFFSYSASTALASSRRSVSIFVNANPCPGPLGTCTGTAPGRAAVLIEEACCAKNGGQQPRMRDVKRHLSTGLLLAFHVGIAEPREADTIIPSAGSLRKQFT